MRPHRLTLSAFGPFPGEETVDFDEVGAAGLLLLHGETGAGKTSILDAVGYALYGAVPGERGVRGLRCEHAGAAAETWVLLEFSVGERRFRIRRSPKQDVPKQRGTGTTTRQPAAQLDEWLGGGWQTVSTRLDEVGLTVGDAVGLTVEQFHQVVLLPQGRFAAFLHAPADQREKLLRSLFGTARFARVEDELAAHRRRVQEERDELARQADLEVLGLARRVGSEEPGDGRRSDWAHGIAARLEAELATADAAAAQAQQHRAAAAETLAATRELAVAQQRRRELEDRLTRSRAEAPAHDARRDRLRRARLAAPLTGDLAREAELAATLRRTVVAAERAVSALPSDVDLAVPALRAAERDALDACANVRALLPLAGELAADETELSAVLAGIARAARTEAAARLAAGRSFAETRAAVDGLEQQLRAARDRALDAREHWLDLARRRLEGMAAELAAGLVDGEPCAVCGSNDHPAPARPAEGAVGKDQEDAARVAAEAAQAAADAVQRRRHEAEAALAPLLAEAGTDDLAVLEAAVADADAACAAAAADLPAETRPADGHASVLQARAAALRATTAERRARLDAARGGERTLEDRLGRLTRRAEDCAAAADALQVVERAGAEHAAAVAALAGAVTAAGFTDVAAARGALLSAAQVENEEAGLAAYDDEIRSVVALLAEPQLQVDLDPPADEAAARAAAELAQRRHEEAVEARARLRAATEAAQATAGRLADLERRLAPVEQRLALVAGLAELAAGGAGNRLNMTLSAFVLAARLEAVAVRASARLSHMTSGRYTLVHTDDLLDGRRRSGLGLAVRDLWTGGERPTSSLSGGETFMTALSLALGLADVVAEETGGRRLDTLFVDEGFGSLDDNALDRVMEVLDGLRDGGRLVGLVSHVAELQRRAPARLEVLRGESGSTLRAHPAPLAD